ncbi:ferredoxin [Streptococcus iniae]
MKVTIIPEKCIACGLCQTYSSLFDYQDDGIVKFTDSTDTTQIVSADDYDSLLAVKSCPTKVPTIQ